MKFRSVFLFFIAMAFATVSNAGSVSFYVVAHEDDWQLFMNPTAFDDVNNPAVDKVVFIYVTAGDAGNRANNTYYTARENGANRSVRFMSDAETAGINPTPAGTTVTINGNSVRKVAYKKTVSYFLRLPDGGDGLGFEANGYQSLQKLYAQQIAAMVIVSSLPPTTTTNSQRYAGWSELTNTLKLIVQLEGTGKNPVVVSMPDPDVSDDHSDHIHTGIAMRDALSSLPCVNQAFFTHNLTGWMAVNVSTDSIINEAATFGAMTTGLAEAGYNSSYDWVHKLAVGKNYFRVVAGTGNCSF